MLIKVHAYWNKPKYFDKPYLSIFNSDMDDVLTDIVPAGVFEVDLPIHDFNATEMLKAQVATLRKQQGQHQHAIDQLEDMIQSLMCIEHKEVVS